MTKKEIAVILKKLRIDAGLTQKRLADLVGKKQQTVASWESGQSQPDADTLFEICRYCGTTVNKAFGFPEYNPARDDFHRQLCEAFDSADPVTQKNICLLLGIENADEKMNERMA